MKYALPSGISPNRHIGRSLTIFCVLLLFFASIGFAQEISEPPFVPINVLLEKAQAQDVLAQIKLAKRYLKGDGVEKNTKQGLFWLSEAEDSDNGEVLHEIGQMYRTGEGVALSSEKAWSYFSRASRKSILRADIAMGEMLLVGEGMPQDKARAYRYFQKAAHQKDPTGLYYTGKLLLEGYGTELPNPEAGLQRLEEAVALDSILALNFLIDAYQHGIPPKIAPQPEKAIVHLEKLANQGSVQAILQLATDFRTGGLEGKPNSEKAVFWYKKGAAKKDPESLFWLGVLSGKGEGTPKSLTESEQYFEESAKLGHKLAQQLLATGHLILPGEGEIYQPLPDVEDSEIIVQFATVDEKDREKSATELTKIGLSAQKETPGNFPRAVAYFTLATEKENPEAQYHLGLCYLKGTGVIKDPKKAVDLFTKAAATKFLPAQAYLGECYIQGIGIAKNGPKGLSLLTGAQKEGDTTALFLLAGLYQVGASPTIIKNIPKAKSLYLEAGKLGMTEAYIALAEIAYTGIDGKKDPAKAREYFASASNLGSSEGYYSLGLLLIKGEGGDAEIKKGMEYVLKAAEMGNPSAQITAGKIYRAGMEEVFQDIPKAIFWFEKVAATGNGEAAFLAGTTFMDSGNFVKAIYWLERAFKRGLLKSANELGRSYQALGKGNQAVYWYEKAAWQEDINAQFNLAQMYETGSGVPQNMVKARYWYEQAAFLGDHPAQFIAAQMALKGIGGQEDLDKALIFAKGVASTKKADAYLLLADIYSSEGDLKNMPLAWAWATLAAEQNVSKASVWIDEIEREFSAKEKDKIQAQKELTVLRNRLYPKETKNIQTIAPAPKPVVSEKPAAVTSTPVAKPKSAPSKTKKPTLKK